MTKSKFSIFAVFVLLSNTMGWDWLTVLKGSSGDYVGRYPFDDWLVCVYSYYHETDRVERS